MSDISSFNNFTIDELEILERCLRHDMINNETRQTDLLQYDLWLKTARTLVNKRSEKLTGTILAVKTCVIVKD